MIGQQIQNEKNKETLNKKNYAFNIQSRVIDFDEGQKQYINRQQKQDYSVILQDQIKERQMQKLKEIKISQIQDILEEKRLQKEREELISKFQNKQYDRKVVSLRSDMDQQQQIEQQIKKLQNDNEKRVTPSKIKRTPREIHKQYSNQEEQKNNGLIDQKQLSSQYIQDLLKNQRSNLSNLIINEQKQHYRKRSNYTYNHNNFKDDNENEIIQINSPGLSENNLKTQISQNSDIDDTKTTKSFSIQQQNQSYLNVNQNQYQMLQSRQLPSINNSRNNVNNISNSNILNNINSDSIQIKEKLVKYKQLLPTGHLLVVPNPQTKILSPINIKQQQEIYYNQFSLNNNNINYNNIKKNNSLLANKQNEYTDSFLEKDALYYFVENQNEINNLDYDSYNKQKKFVNINKSYDKILNPFSIQNNYNNNFQRDNQSKTPSPHIKSYFNIQSTTPFNQQQNKINISHKSDMDISKYIFTDPVENSSVENQFQNQNLSKNKSEFIQKELIKANYLDSDDNNTQTQPQNSTVQNKKNLKQILNNIEEIVEENTRQNSNKQLKFNVSNTIQQPSYQFLNQ